MLVPAWGCRHIGRYRICRNAIVVDLPPQGESEDICPPTPKDSDSGRGRSPHEASSSEQLSGSVSARAAVDAPACAIQVRESDGGPPHLCSVKRRRSD